MRAEGERTTSIKHEASENRAKDEHEKPNHPQEELR
jgi:hypothetical protein